MILPVLSGIPSLSKAPITWTLILLYTICFVCFKVEEMKVQNLQKSLLDDKLFIRAQGKAYTQYLMRNESKYDSFLLDMALASSTGQLEKTSLLGSLAFRDWPFLKAKENFFSKDQVESNYWNQKLNIYLKKKEQTPSFYFGLSAKNQEWYHFLSYQFVHGSIWHLLFNCWFLLIFGGFLEPLIGYTFFLLTYLLGGSVGAITFAQISKLSFFPLIGASASINALIGFFAVLCFREPIRLLLGILPIRGWWKWIFLPTWLFIGVWLLTDISGYLGTLPGFVYVAHTAHLGGLALGIIGGLMYQKITKTKSFPTITKNELSH